MADILQWEFPVRQFDAIVSIATVHHLPIENLLPKLEAALKPGGKLVILDLLENGSLHDILLDAFAVPVNWIFQLLKNRRSRLTPEAVKALREHIAQDKYLTLSQAQQIYTKALTGTTIRRHLFWRYSAIWEK